VHERVCICIHIYKVLTYLAAVEFLKIYTSPWPDSVYVSFIRYIRCAYIVCVYTKSRLHLVFFFWHHHTLFTNYWGPKTVCVCYIYFSHNIFSHDDDCISVRLKGCCKPHMFPTYYLLMFLLLRLNSQSVCMFKLK